MIHDIQGAQISQMQHGYSVCVTMKTMRPNGYHHIGSVATHALEHMMFGYILLLPMNQGVINKPSKEYNVSGHK